MLRGFFMIQLKLTSQLKAKDMTRGGFRIFIFGGSVGQGFPKGAVT